VKFSRFACDKAAHHTFPVTVASLSSQEGSAGGDIYTIPTIANDEADVLESVYEGPDSRGYILSLPSKLDRERLW
jgi:hypothetical protein